MKEESLERELRDHFNAEVKKVEPSPEWWNNAISRLGEQKQNSRPEKSAFWKLRPSLIAVPLSIFLLVVLVGSFIPMLGGMAPPPPSAPLTISDQASGAFLVWLDKPYHQYEAVIRAQHVDAQGNHLWGEKGRQIASSDASLNGAVSDGIGGMIVAWRNSNGSSFERLDQAGNTVWTLENITSWSVMGMVEDGSGGAILLLYDRSDRICAQRVSGDGIPLWGDEGVLVDTTGDDYPNASIASDGQGGVVVVWQEKSGRDMMIRAQRLSGEGLTLWGNEGIIVTSIAEGQGNYMQVIGDGLGNFVVAWDTGSVTPDTDVYAQKLDDNGNPQWGEGILVCQDQAAESYNPANMQSHPQMAADGTGGVIITWHDRRRILNREIFAQRISSAGEMLWTENGVWVWNIPADYFMTTSGILDATIIPDGAGGAAIVWTGYEVSYTRDTVIYAQRLSPDGQRLWSEEEVYGEPSFQSQGNSSIVSDGKGGIIIGSRVGESSGVSQTNSVYAQRISPNGDRLWGESGLEIQKVCSALTVQFIVYGAILAALLVLIGVFRRNRIAGIFTAIMPVLLGIAGLFSTLLVIGPFGYTYGWAYIPDTALNKLGAFLVPLAGLVIVVVGISKKTVTKWVMIPVLVFCTLISVIAGLIFFF
ncbi:MAG: hypothetical protein Q7T57_03595 [Dehalococcoidales bacterium]|nr:hypothetical protein [Dehalococcoidales bacterium]